MGTTSGATNAASDALGPVLRAVRLAPDPIEVWLLCQDGPPRVRASRDALAVRMPGCVHTLPLSGFLELAAAGATAVRRVPGPCCRDVGEPSALTDARTLVVRHRLPVDLAPAPAAPARRRLARAVPDAASLPLPRRALFVPLALTRVPPRGRSERDRLLDALAALGAGVGDLPPQDAPAERGPDPSPVLASAPPAGTLLDASGCTGCGVCVRGCPQSALDLVDGDGTRVLRQDVARCTDCGDCLALCPQAALSRAGAVSWQQVEERTVRTLAVVTTTAPCRRCGQPLAAGQDHEGLCPVCAYRRAHPFGSAAPPAAASR